MDTLAPDLTETRRGSDALPNDFFIFFSTFFIETFTCLT